MHDVTMSVMVVGRGFSERCSINEQFQASISCCITINNERELHH